jgi:excisionase family DNA binding protein
MSRDVHGESDDRALLLTVAQVCTLLHRSKARVYEMVRMRELGHIRDGRSVLIPREALDEWIRKKRRQAGC